jgi:iron complex transport system permease protein
MKTGLKYFILLLAGAALVLMSLSFGSEYTGPLKVLSILSGPADSIDYQILINIRFPRIIMALVIGAALSVSGTVFQAIFRNPLSDPYTTGVSGGAALGATIAVSLSLGNFYITLLAFIGSVAAVFTVYSISRLRGFGSLSLILSGLALSFILSSGVLLIFTLTRAEQVHKALLWLMGDLSLARYAMIWKMSLASLILIALTWFHHRHLDILSFGEDFAGSMGITRGDTLNLFITASLLAAVSVSLAGVIGFVGLIVPHVMRWFFGPSHSRLIPASAVGGAVFLMLADTLGRIISKPYEIPAGIVTGFFGGIFFLAVLIRRGGE